jgi:hypothetical protein
VIPATATPTITSVTPAYAPNDGDVAVTITGTGFNAESTVKLVSPYFNDAPIYATIVSWTPTSIACTFSLKGKTPTQYHVFVNSPFTNAMGNYFAEDVGMLMSGFTIYQGAGTTVTTTTTPAFATGNISVSSIPSGANIYLDNEYKGLTPLTLKNVENGYHVVLIRLAGYRDFTDEVAVLGNSPSVSAKLNAIPTTTASMTTAPATTAATPPPATLVPTTKSPLGIELGIIATLGALLLSMKRT